MKTYFASFGDRRGGENGIVMVFISHTSPLQRTKDRSYPERQIDFILGLVNFFLFSGEDINAAFAIA